MLLKVRKMTTSAMLMTSKIMPGKLKRYLLPEISNEEWYHWLGKFGFNSETTKLGFKEEILYEQEILYDKTKTDEGPHYMITDEEVEEDSGSSEAFQI